MMPTTTYKSEYLTLSVATDESGGSATVNIGWCLTDFGAAELAKREIGQAFLLICAVQFDEDGEIKDERRALYPLSRRLVLERFPRPGLWRIYTAIVWAIEDFGRTFVKPWSWVLTNSTGKYRTPIGYNPGEALYGGSECSDHPQSDDPECFLCERMKNLDEGLIGSVVEVDVPKGIFAEIPTGRMGRWINLWWGQKLPQNECQLRKRKLVAFSVQPIAMALWYFPLFSLLRLAAAVLAFLVGLRGIHPSRILMPWRSFDELLTPGYDGAARLDVWPIYRRSEEAVADRRPWWMMVLMPVIPLAILWIGRSIWGGWLWPVVLTAGIMGFAIALLWLIQYLQERPSSAGAELEAQRRAAKQKARAELKARQQRERQHALTTTYVGLVCGAPPTTVAALPKASRTLLVRLEAFKGRVCKEFAR